MLGRISEPDFLGTAQTVDFFLHFLQEDFADIVIDTFRVGIEMGVGRQCVANRHLLVNLFLDFGPVTVLMIRRALHRDRWRRRLGLCQPQPIQIVDRCCMRLSSANKQMPQVITGKQGDRFRKFRVLLILETVTGVCIRPHFGYGCRDRGHRTRGWQRPVTEQAKAVFGHVEDMLQAATMFTRSLEVVLQRGECIGQMIHLRPTGHTPVTQQFIADEAAHAFSQFGWTRCRQHAHRAGNLVHQGRSTGQAVVLPARFDEGNDRVLHLAGIADRFLHQGRDDTQRFAARQTLHGVAGSRLALGGAQTLDVIVQRGLDI